MLIKRRLSWKANEEKRKQAKFIHDQATKIQSLWRGYLVRKETSNILGGIRTRLSVYVQSKGKLREPLNKSLASSVIEIFYL